MSIQKFSEVIPAELPALDVPGVDALMKDFASKSSNGAPITFGMFRMSKGDPLPYEYEFDEYKLVLEGELAVEDESGTTTTFTKGDVIEFAKGTKAVFSSPSTALTFYVAQR
ncbi:MAG: cupin domain-containing protein [Sulfitobacter sp.]